MSIKSQLQSKAIALAEAGADRAKTPQEIEALRQRIMMQIKDGTLQSYVGVPLVQELTTKLNEARQKMAQMVSGMGTPPAPQGPPIAQQIMAQAEQPTGIESLPSNLPQSYAPGGLVAFAEGGDVERYQQGGSPAGRWWQGLKSSFSDADEAAQLRNELQMKYGPASAVPGLFMTQTDEQRQQAKQIAQLLPNLTLPQLRTLKQQGAAAIPSLSSTGAGADLGPVPGTTGSDIMGGMPGSFSDRGPQIPEGAMFTQRPAAAPTVPGVRMPQVNLATYTPDALPQATDFNSLVNQLPEKAKTAFETARDTEEKYLRGLTEPGETAREERFKAREAALEKDTAMGRALNLISLGFGIAGSKERTLAGALGREGREGIQALIQGEAANRVAKERLEDARDNFEQQKVAMRKGDRAAASAAGQRAADDLRAYTQLNMQAAQAGSQEAMQRYQAGEQSKQFQVGEANKASLGLAGLNLQAQSIAQQGAIASLQLQLGRERLNIIQKQIEAGDARAKAALAGAQAKAFANFQNDTQTRMLLIELQKKYGSLQHPEAQRQIQQARATYMMNAVPSLLGAEGAGGSSVKDVAELLKD